MNFFANLWNVIWTLFCIVAFVSYLIALFSVVTDIFRDHALKGWAKALWLLFLFVVPILTLLVYLIARGNGMAARSARVQQQADAAARDYIRAAAGTSPAEEIARADALLKAGTITQAEFDQLKARALAGA